MEMREWLSIIVIVAIVLIVLDGLRRKRKERNPVRMKLDKNLPPASVTDEDDGLAELPGGRARTIPRDQFETSKPNRDKADKGKHGRKSKMEEKVRFAEKVPVLMESVNIATEVEATEARDEEEQPLYADTGEPVLGLQQEELRAGRRGRDDDDGYDDEDEDEDDFEDEDEDEEDDDYEDDDEDEFADEDDEEYRSDSFDGNDEFDDEYEDDELDDEDEDDLDEEEDDELDEDYDEEGEYRLRGTEPGGRIEPTFAEDALEDEAEDAALAAFDAEDDDEEFDEDEEAFEGDNFEDDEFEDDEFEDEEDEDLTAAAAAAAAMAAAAPKVQRSQLSRDLQGELQLGPEDYDSGEIAETDDDLGAAEEVIVINVMARRGTTFQGSDLLPILLSQGMRLGDMSIFHRHADSSGNGPVIFSMANMVKPGTFDLGSMNEFSTPGISFFQQLPGPLNNMKNFERMLNTATTLRDALDGELKDENRSVLTRQTIEHYRQRIRDFELRQELSRKQLH